MVKKYVMIMLVVFCFPAIADNSPICEMLIGDKVDECKSIKGALPTFNFAKNNWTVVKDSDVMTDELSYTFARFDDEFSLENDTPRYLAVQCKKNKTSIMISWGEMFSTDVDVTYRLDKSKALTSKWAVSPGKSTTVYKGNAGEFINKLNNAKKLLVRTKPFASNRITMSFGLDTFETAYRKIKEVCNI